MLVREKSIYGKEKEKQNSQVGNIFIQRAQNLSKKVFEIYVKEN